MQTRQRIFKYIRMQVFYFSRQNSETFDISRILLPLTIAKLSTLKNNQFFVPTLYLCAYSTY